MYNYIKNGQNIYDHSFAIIRQEANLAIIDTDMEKVAVRIIHACGMVDIVNDLRFSKHAGTIGRNAMKNGATILCDASMVANGITKKRLPTSNNILCTLNDDQVPEIAKKIGNTRSAASLELWRNDLEGSIVAIGNAPTALFYLLELLANGAPHPALILGFPVGFVGAAESKQALIENNLNIPYIAVTGRRGGSAMAAAAVNALANEIE